LAEDGGKNRSRPPEQVDSSIERDSQARNGIKSDDHPAVEALMRDSSRSRNFGSVRATVVHRNIAELEADVLVNAANNQLQMGGGVAAALRSRGGIEIHQEAVQNAPAAIGAVVKTRAGRLAARFVYHAVVIDYDVSKGTAAADVRTVVENILRMAEADAVGSIGLPLFGAGVGGLSVETSLQMILSVLEEVGSRFSRPLNVIIAVRDVEEFEQARRVLESYLDAESRAREEDNAASDFLNQYLKNRPPTKSG
jgi:O-acetyl-ADP-ribose deacetylase (regulator of RNase III)